MGYDNEFAPRDHAVVFDIETIPLQNAADFIEPPDLEHVKVPKSYKKPESIDAYLVEKRAELQQEHLDKLAKCSLDWNVGRIVALGAWWPGRGVPTVVVLQTERAEADLLQWFWNEWRQHQRPRLVGFRCRLFDLPFLIQRSRYLHVPVPTISMDRYRGTDLTDLYELLTFGDTYGTTWVMRRTLDLFCRRFGLDVPDDPHSGKEIAALVAAADWEAVAAHCRCDVIKTRRLAERLDVLQGQVSAEEAVL